MTILLIFANVVCTFSYIADVMVMEIRKELSALSGEEGTDQSGYRSPGRKNNVRKR